MKFPYVKLPGGDQKPWFPRPLLPIRLYGPKESIAINALVDSGADRSLFHESVGTAIGLGVMAGRAQDFFGIGGNRVPVYLHKIRFSVDGLPGDHEMLAGFSPGEGIGALLGQEGFFDVFKISFERHRNIFEVSPIIRR